MQDFRELENRLRNDGESWAQHLFNEAADALAVQRVEIERLRAANVGQDVGAELGAYRDAALYDPTMEGPRFKGWDRSQLDRARRMTEAAIRLCGVDCGAGTAKPRILKPGEPFIQELD